MEKRQKVMEFFDQSWNFIKFASAFYQICAFFADIKKLGISLVSLYLLQKYGHWKFRNSHGEVMEKYFAKSVGTLIIKNNSVI